MSIFYVYQRITYKYQKEGGYLWSPQKTIDEKDNPGFYTMKDVKPGDVVLHAENKKTRALSIVTRGCYLSKQPIELKALKKNYDWKDDGYRVDSTYYELTTPLSMTEHYEWFKDHYISDSAFNQNGSGLQRYLCNLHEDHAIYLLEQILKLPQAQHVKSIVQALLIEIAEEKDSEYNPLEIIEMDSLLEDAKHLITPIWKGKIEVQDFTTNIGSGKKKPKRDPKRAVNALVISDFYCEYSRDDKIFIRKNGTRYTEPHHLIPMSKYEDFYPNRVDIEENIVSLCSHCHNLLHYGRLENKEPILQKLYNERKEALKKVGLEISFDQLLNYYK